MGFCCQAFAAGPLWLGSHRLNASFFVEVAKGNVPGHSIVHKFGHSDVGTTLQPITFSGVYKTPTTAVALEFVSDDVNDTAAGTGAREITITGIGVNYDEITQVIATNGTTAVAIPISLLRLYEWYVSASGTYATQSAGSHVGTLIIRVASAGATWSAIDDIAFPHGRSEIGVYTIPDGYRGYIIHQDIDVDSNKSAEITIFKREGIDIITAPFTPMTVVSDYVGVSGHRPGFLKIPMNSFPARTDIGFMGRIASGTADITVHFGILLIEDGY